MAEPLPFRGSRPSLTAAQALVGHIVRWFPGKGGDRAGYVLAFGLGVSPRFGWWDLTIMPLAGGGTFKVSSQRLELHDQQGAAAILALITHLQTELSAPDA